MRKHGAMRSQRANEKNPSKTMGAAGQVPGAPEPALSLSKGSRPSVGR